MLRRPHTRAKARIYVNGLRVAEEDNFLFSYNITSPTDRFAPGSLDVLPTAPRLPRDNMRVIV